MKIFTLTFLALILYSSNAIADQKKEYEFFNEVQKKIRVECKNSKNFRQCRSEQTPKKCRVLAFNSDLSGWASCVKSCANASILSRTLGECS
jgi:hypothetical protein